MEFLLVPIVGAVFYAFYKLVRLRPVPPDLVARFEELERKMESLQQQLAETQERLDFAERMLSKAREQNRIG
jgi:chaperonin cofactor prefoldin